MELKIKNPSRKTSRTKKWNKMMTHFENKGFSLYNPYQTDGVNWMLDRELHSDKHSGGILADDCGLGKTIQTLATMYANKLQRTLLVVPNCVLHQWYDLCVLLFPKAAVILHHGPSRTKTSAELEALFKKTSIVVTTYGMIVNGKKTKKTPTPVNSILQEIKWSRVVCDEIHILRNKKTKQSQSVKDLKTDIIWGLTGTPVQNSIADLKTLYTCLKFPSHLLKDDSDYYAKLNSEYILRRTKADVVDMVGEMPELTVKIAEVPFRHPAEKKWYKETSEQIFSEIRRSNTDPMHLIELLLRLRQTCIHPQIMLDGLARKFGLDDGAITFDEVSTKFQIISEMMDTHRDEKTLVFCYFKKEIEILSRWLGSHGWSVFVIDGSKSMAERKDIIRQAEACTEPTVMLIQIQAGAVGMNLQFASQSYFTSPNWNPSMEIQAIARTHRLGQKRPVTATKIIIKEDDVVEDFILRKQEIKRQIMATVLCDDTLLNNGKRVSIE